MASTTLYPPILDSYQPSFLISEGCNIKFTISDLNSTNDISCVQLAVYKIQNNNNALEYFNYPNNIKIYTNLNKDGEKIFTELKEITWNEDNISGSINLSNNDIQGGFQTGCYYKIQLRFCDSTIKSYDEKTASWFLDNADYFSEWSKSTLIKGITDPTITLTKLSSTSSSIITSSLLTLSGSIIFSDTSEYIQSYSFKIKKQVDGNYKDFEDSGTLYSEDNKTLNYTVSNELMNGTSYQLTLSYTTNNLYAASIDYFFTISYTQSSADLGLTVTSKIIPEIGGIRLFISGLGDYPTYIVRRTSSRTNYEQWENVFAFKQTEGIYYEDVTIESGVFYKYRVYGYNKDEGYSSSFIFVNENFVALEKISPPEDWDLFYYTYYKYNKGKYERLTSAEEWSTEETYYKDQSMLLCFFDDLFLIAGDRQLKIKFSNAVSSYTRNIMDSKTDTIGSKYPFIKRNAKVNYRQYSLTGLITFMNDELDVQSLNPITDSLNRDSITLSSSKSLMANNATFLESPTNSLIDSPIKYFMSPTEIYEYAKVKNDYEEYNKNHNITVKKDYILERELRKKVEDFLIKDNIKLMRNLTEGNCLVRLMDVSLAPKTDLNNYLYTFTATAYEIDDLTLDNIYDTYKVITLSRDVDNPSVITAAYIGTAIADKAVVVKNKEV